MAVGRQRLGFSLERSDDSQELLDRLKVVKRLDHAVQIEVDVFVDQDVAEPW